MTTPLVAAHAPDGPILHLPEGDRRRTIDASRFAAAVIALAGRLPRRRYALQR